MSKSQVFVQGVVPSGTRVWAYSALNGDLLPTFDLPARISGASTNGRELFLGFGTDSDGDGVPSVRAYHCDGY